MKEKDLLLKLSKGVRLNRDEVKFLVNLATTTNITSTYAGEFSGEYVGASLFSATTIENGGVTVRPNIKYKEVVGRVSTTDIVHDLSCDFTPTGTITKDERILEPKELEVNLNLCKKDFIRDWEAELMGFSAWDSMPPNFQAFLIARIGGVVADKTEVDIWGGVGANDGEFDGFTTLFAADANVIDVTSTAITSANVVAEMQKVVDAIPNRVYKAINDDLNLYVSPDIWRAYTAALGGFGANGLGANGYMGQGPANEGVPLRFNGVAVFMADGMPAGQMVAARVSNLWFGTGLLNDMTEVKIKDMTDVDLSHNFRFAMAYTAGVQYGFGEEIVYYWPNV